MLAPFRARSSAGLLSRKCHFSHPFIAMIRSRNIDVRALRKRLGMTQEQFCRRFGFELATLRHWERGDRKPRGPALVLLNVVRHNPGAVVKAVLNTAFRERFPLSQPPPIERGPIGRPRGRWRVPV
ncbi:MAG TPA: helix-turn-helix domain-containing protein [Usitatibacter sp.]|nr:helix-turn-helix domain-containing protein [Usitatibacter sp.]